MSAAKVSVEDQPKAINAGRRPGWLSRAELANYLGVEQEWVYKRLQPNHPDMIPHFRFGTRLIRIDVMSERFQRWLARYERYNVRQEVETEAKIAPIVRSDSERRRTKDE